MRNTEREREGEKEAGQRVKKIRSHVYCTWFSNFPADSTTPISLALLCSSLSLTLCVQTGGRCVPEPGNSSGNQEPKKKKTKPKMHFCDICRGFFALGKRTRKKDSLNLSSVQYTIDLGRNSTIFAIGNERKTLLDKT